MTTVTALASLALFIGLFLVGRRDRWGFAFTVAGETVWTVVALDRGQYDLAAVCGVFAALALLNLRKWSSESR